MLSIHDIISIVTALIALFCLAGFYWDDIIDFVNKFNQRKYKNSDLYKFQQAKIRQRLTKYYKSIGYIDPSFIVDKQMQELEQNNEIDKLYKAQKDYYKL